MSRLFDYAPLAEPYRITQRFGENPQYYQQFNLRYHEGIDLVAKDRHVEHDPVHVVASGQVLLADRQDQYGLVVKVGHGKFETTYAHLSTIVVEVGDSLEAGQVLGFVGNTGNSTGAHLHFGLRVQPWITSDGMAGYSNPGPHLEHLYRWPGAPIGVHIQDQYGKHREHLRRLQPAVITFLHPNVDDVLLARDELPHTILVGRHYKPDEEYRRLIMDAPEANGVALHEELAQLPWVEHVHWVQGPNEVCQSYHWQSETDHRTELGQHNKFSLAWMQAADALGLYKCGIGAWSVGNPDVDPEGDRGATPMHAWELFYPALEYAESHGHAMLAHQYGWPDMWGPAEKGGYDWLGGRIEHQVLWRLPFRKLPVIMSEYGLDGLLVQGSPMGWKGQTGAASYVNQLTSLGSHTRPWATQILGYTVYCLGQAGHEWISYDIAGDVLRLLADFYEVERRDWPMAGEPPTELPPPTLPPPPETDMEYRRTSQGWKDLQASIIPFHERDDFSPPTSDSDEVWVIKDAFTTRDGSWQSGDTGATRPEVWGVPTWAPPLYLTPYGSACYFDDAGGDHHIFGALWPNADDHNVGCEMDKNAEVLFWSDNRDVPHPGDDSKPVKDRSGWANIVMYASSNFNPDETHGPWRWQATAARCDIAKGGGMPWNNHVSFFAIWTNITWGQYKELFMGETPPVEPPTQPPTQPPGVWEEILAEILAEVRRLREFIVDGDR